MSFLHKRKRVPNVTNLVTSGMPRGRGRKGGITPRTRKTQSAATTRVPISLGDMPVRVEQAGEMSISSGFNYSPVNVIHPPANYPEQPGVSISSNVNFSPMNMVPSYPPTSYYPGYFPASPSPYQPSDAFTPFNPFILCFIKGNISTCIGCHNHYPKSPQPPNDICLRHQEWRQFTPQGKETPQTKFSNVYYHCNPLCVWHRHPNFNTANVVITEIENQLTPIHKAHLTSYFGLHF